MKKSLTFLLFFLTAMLAHAGATLTLDEGLKVKQGETFTVNVNLTNEKAVSGIEMKISLPSGLSFVGTEEEGEMYYGEATDRSSASFSGATLNGNTLTVAFLATAAKNRIKAGSGSILTLTIKAAADATVGIGKIKLFGMEIAYPGESPENPADAEYDCNIYNIFSITASSANEELGSVTGGGTYDSGTTATLTATATEGYHFQKWSNGVTDNPYSFIVTGAANLVASFAPNQYKMTFVLDNGEEDIVKTLDYKSELKAPENVTKKGHSFTGWNPEVPTTVPLGDKTYTAQWKVNQYTMTFVLGNGEKDVVITQDYGTPLVAPETPIRKGYTFAGWSPAVDATIPAENKTFTAQWTLGTYTITYDLNGGALAEGVTNPASYTTESESFTLNNPTYTGYTFAGWTGTDLEEPTKTVTIAKGSAGNRSYKATWTPITYTITYDLDGGALAEGVTNPESYTTESGSITLNNPIRTGYTFAGWTGTDLTEATTTVLIANGSIGNRSYKATWTINKYKVTFKDYNDDILVAEAEYDYDSDLTNVAPDMTGKTNLDGAPFGGWNNNYTGKVPAFDVVYTAVYGGTYMLKFVVDGVTVQSGEVDYNTPITAPTSPEKEGYDFTGWKDQIGKDFTEYNGKMPAKDVTFTAQWKAKQYTITIDTDGGSTIENITADYNSAIEKPADPTKKGYKFTGWTPAFPETMPLNGASVKATWEIITYTLSYDLAGGALAEGVTNPENFTVESDGFTLNNPTRTGYTFAGWTGTGLEEPTKTVTIAKGSTESRSYKAVWTINKYKVSFKDYNDDVLVAEAEYDYDSDLTNVAPDMTGKTNLDGAPFGGWDNEYTGKVPAFDVVYTAVYGGTFMLKFVVDGVTVQSGEVDYNTPITAPTSPEKEGYDFKGWKDQNGKDFTEYNGKMPAKDVTFTAQWKAQQYTVTFVLNNGSENIVYTQDYGSPVVAPTDPVKKGHTFQGWTPELATTVPTHNLTYEATYQINTYNVIYMVYGEEWARDQYTYDSPIEIRQYVGTILDDFRGWQSDAEYTTMPDHDVTYVADITKLDPIVITSDMIQNINDMVYTGKAIEPTLTVKNGELILVEGTDYSVSYSDNIIVGTAKVTVTAIQGSCYQGSADKTFKIVKADVIIKKAPAGLNLVYTGQPQALVDAGEIEGGTILFSEDGETYSERIPTGTEMGDYTVYYKIIGDANHYDVGVQTLTASIKGFPVVVGAGEYVTYYSDRALKLDAAETEAKLYTVTDVNGSVATISQLSVAAANTPLLVYNNGAEAKTIVLIPTDDAPENIAVYNGFKGTFSDQQMNGSSDAKDYYVVSGEYFSLVRNAGTIKANRCWLEINKNISQSAPRLIIGGGGEGTTGIDGVDIEDANDGNWYDLNGRKLQGKPAQKGLYIKDGKKVVVK